MKKHSFFLLLALLLLMSGRVLAAANTPEIMSFTSSVAIADRAALAQRTARIPVSWTTANRPIFANLVFEQVLPDGGVINVELPRIIPWVNSNGDGIAAPILPSENATEIRLRVRLVNLLSAQTLSERTLILPIGRAGGQGTNTGYRPAITRFTTCCPSVRSDQLQARTARVPVSWTAVNRPITATLVFEQVLADGSVVNVELPRENPWVNSVGDGVAAPVPPGGDANEVYLRVRLLDLFTGRVYDQQSLRVAITRDGPAGSPRILYFTTNATRVTATALAQRTERVPLSWSVDNRPADANLYFEQVMDDGRVVNVELPRQIAWVASAGDGVAAPLLPATADHIVLRVRLANMDTGQTLDSKQFTLPIEGRIGRVADEGDDTNEGGSDTTDGIPAPTINSFTADKTDVHPNEMVTVSWDVKDALSVAVVIQAPDTDAPLVFADNQPLIGSAALNIPFDTPVDVDATIRLHVYTMADVPAAEIRELPLRIAAPSCSHTFFFGESEDCAGAAVVDTEAAFQTFERGLMIWRGDTRTVYVLLNGGGISNYTESWQSGEITVEDTPPAGMLVPQQGFGQVWQQNAQVRDALGWATAPQQGYAGQFQDGTVDPSLTANVLYMSTPDGRIIRAQDGAWRFQP